MVSIASICLAVAFVVMTDAATVNMEDAVKEVGGRMFGNKVGRHGQQMGENSDREEMVKELTVLQSIQINLESQIEEIGRRITESTDIDQVKALTEQERSLYAQHTEINKQVVAKVAKLVNRDARLGDGRSEEDVVNDVKKEMAQFAIRHQDRRNNKRQRTDQYDNDQLFARTESERPIPEDVIAENVIVTEPEEELEDDDDYEWTDDDDYEEDDGHFGKSLFADAEHGHLGKKEAEEDEGGFCGGPDDEDEDEESIEHVNSFDAVAEAILERRIAERNGVPIDKDNRKAIPKPSRLSADEKRIWNKKLSQAVKKQERRLRADAMGQKV